MIEGIERYVVSIVETLSSEERITLKCLVYAGYKGERRYVLEELIISHGGDGIHKSELTEEFTSAFEAETARYVRIKPEYYRAVRKILFEK